ncbi:hypothetical protein HF263_17655 [Rhizobium leguminosarum]|uniref:hypothetical protein n=1 Tax=Rhizobium leguminosarum TaxID=384 RepID=UPI001C902163|nr:hypothetical protein [Rhizobium leguminosarum]MBY2992606.1 hypothetical protein [Rhizobium leguminosarum]MBY3057885.1 hypothetical protein [Rhizobium leguminosarum]
MDDRLVKDAGISKQNALANILIPKIQSFWVWYKKGGDILLFVAYSLLLTIYMGQERIVSRGDLLYWLLTLPTVAAPLPRVRQTVENLIFGCARPLAAMGLIASIWFGLKGDMGVIPPIVLIAWVSAWASRSEVRINIRWLFAIILVFYGLGSLSFVLQPPFEKYSWLMHEYYGDPLAADSGDIVLPPQDREGIDINPWGILPGQTAPAYGPWRISMVPNIATSGTISLFVFLIALKHLRFRWLTITTAVATGYFTILSFVRSALIGLVLFSATTVVLKLLPDNARLRVTVAFAMTLGLILIVGISPLVLYHLQDIPLISRLLLRNQSGLSLEAIYRQAYRPWLWLQHLQIFWQSDDLMGYGSSLAQSATKKLLNAGQVRSDSVSLPTRLLATYGLPALGFLYFLGERCYTHAKNNDIWAVSMLSLLIWLMMTWGSIFHPTNAIFVLALLIIGRGGSAFHEHREQQ